jgi:transcriptional regulator with XRE-family HTH domain
MPKQFEWSRGQQAELARTAEISAAYLCDILHARKTPRIDVAKRLAAASAQLRVPLKLTDWIDPASSASPLIQK